MLDPDRKKVFVSCDVRFNESEVGSQKELSLVEPFGYVELEGSVECDDSEVCNDVFGEQVDGQVGEDDQPAPRRSERARFRPNYYAEGAFVSADGTDDPQSYQEAMASPNKSKWEEAMKAEMRSFEHDDVWELVELPKDGKAVGSKWVFKVKVNGDGCVERYKARLVAQGFTQKKETNYDETFAPVVRIESLRMVIGLAVSNGLSLHQLDVMTAILNGNLEEVVSMRQPEGLLLRVASIWFIG